MLDCRYKLNIDGYIREFESDRELTEFIKNRLKKRKIEGDIQDPSLKFSSPNLDSYQNRALNIFYNDVHNQELTNFDILRINENLKAISDSIGDVPWFLNKSRSGDWYVAGYKNAPVTSENYYSPYANGRYSSSKYSVKFSLSDAQAKVESELSKISKTQEGPGAKLNGKDVDSKSDYYFLHSEHEIDGTMQYLSPTMNNDNYIQNLIQLIKTDPNEISEELKNLSDEELEKHLKVELEKDNKMLEISRRVTGLITMVQQDRNYYHSEKAISEYFELVNKYNKEEVVYTETSKRELHSKIVSFLEEKIDGYNGVVKPGFDITDPDQTVNSKISLLINSDKLNIFRVAVSRKPYGLWDPAKKLDQDYYLALRRHILNYYTDATNASMFVVPVVIPETNGRLDPLSFTVNDPINRTNELKMDFKQGIIENKLNQILPSIVRETEIINSEIDAQNRKVLDAIFQNYNIKSQTMITNVGNLYNDGLKNGKNHDSVWIYNRITGRRIEESKNTVNWEEKFKKKVEDYVKEYNNNSTNRLVKLTNLISDTKKQNGNWLRFSERFDSTKLNLVFGKYLNEDWSMVANADLLNVGIVLFRNYKKGLIEVVSVTSNELDAIYNMGAGKTILGKFAIDKMVEKDPLIMKSNGTNIETMKVLAVLNNMPQLFKGGLRLSSIVVYNQINDKTNFVNLDRALYNFEILLKKPREKFTNNFKDRNIILADIATVVYAEILDKASESITKDISSLGDPTSLYSTQEKLNWFLQLQRIMESKYSNLKSKGETSEKDFNDPVLYTYYLLSSAIAHYNHLAEEFDYGTPRLGVRFGDITHLIYTTFTGESPDFDKNGNPIVGILQGSRLNTTDSMGSKGIGKLHDLISITQNAIVREYNIELNKIKNKTISFYESSNRSNLQKDLIGDADFLHQKFARTESTTGKISREMMFVNPYSSKCALKTHERDYLKFILFEIYKYNDEFSDSALSNDVNRSFQNMTLEEAEKKEDFMKMVSDDNSRYFEIPLVKRMGMSEMKVFTTEKFWKVIGQKFQDVKTILDPRNLFDEQRAELQRKVNKGVIHNIFNQFDLDPKFRQQLIDKYGVGAFEINLDTIALKYTMARIKERKYNKLLPNMKAALTVMQFHAWKTGETEELQKAMEDFYKQLQVAVYDESPIKGEEGEDIVAWVKKFQRIASVMAISLRPALLIKELVVGTIKNASFAWSKIYGDDSFTANDLTKAYQIMFNAGATGELRNEFNLTDAINQSYRIANMDLNTVVDKTKIDRRGMMFFSDKLFWMNTAPDYVNRMSLFLSKMIHDGSYEAHSLDKNGMLIYDPAKDKRFAHYFAKRESYKKDGKFGWTEDKLYNDQRATYLAVLEEINGENLVTGEKQLTESDKIDRAYTNKDRDSIKEFTDTAYGYYDHERSPLIRNTAFGIIFMQFLAFWPAKIKYYLGKPGSNTKRGYWGQKVDSDGNNLFLKTETNEEGEEITYETTIDTGIPSKAWIGTKAEGLMYSLVACIRDLKNGNKTTTRDQKARAKVAVHDILLGMLLMLIASLILKNYKAKVKEDGEMLSWAQEYSTKILMKSMQEFDPVQSIFNSVKWTPAFVSILSNSVNSFTGIFSGNSDLDKFFRTSFRALEILAPKETK